MAPSALMNWAILCESAAELLKDRATLVFLDLLSDVVLDCWCGVLRHAISIARRRLGVKPRPINKAQSRVCYRYGCSVPGSKAHMIGRNDFFAKSKEVWASKRGKV